MSATMARSGDNTVSAGAAPDPAALGAPPSAELRSVMGLRCWDVDLPRAARFLVDRALSGEPLQVYFVNAHCVNVAAHDPAYREALARAPFVFADGAGMALAARIGGSVLEHNVNGTDLFPELCAAAAAAKLPIALLGSRPGVAEACARRMTQQHPGLRVVWVADGYLGASEEDARLIELNASGARMLFVAKGVPMQELWMAAHAGRLAAPVLLGVGALLDFYSGSVKRAPPLVRRLRLEWLYRLAQEPRRLFARYVIGNPAFVARALYWRLRH